MSIITPYQKNILNILGDPNANKRMKQGIVNSCDTKTINKICEIVLNVLNKNIKLDESQLDNLKPKEKKKILLKKGIQRGGFLQFIIPAVISGIATIISSLITKKSE
jgi:hypothetical protein